MHSTPSSTIAPKLGTLSPVDRSPSEMRLRRSFLSEHQGLNGLASVANTTARLPREIFSQIASYLEPHDVIAFSALDKECAENLRGERIFSKAILQIDNLSAEDLTLDAFGALLRPILHDIPQGRLAGDALLRLVIKMRFPAGDAGRTWFNQILNAQHIAPAKKAETLAALAQKNNILRVDKSAFQHIMDVIAEMPPALRSAETCEQAKACNTALKYHRGALTGLAALSVTQPTEAKKHATLVALIDALKDIPVEHRAAPLYQIAWFLGYFKDRQCVFDRVVDAVKMLLPRGQRAYVLQRLESELWRLRPKQREQAKRSLQLAALQ